jgi:hypothetical protein
MSVTAFKVEVKNLYADKQKTIVVTIHNGAEEQKTFSVFMQPPTILAQGYEQDDTVSYYCTIPTDDIAINANEDYKLPITIHLGDGITKAQLDKSIELCVCIREKSDALMQVSYAVLFLLPKES